MLGVAADPAEQGRGDRGEEEQPHEVQAGRVGDHAPVVVRLVTGVEHRQVDPAEVVAEPGAPDDVGHLQDPPVLQQGQAVAGPDRPRHPLDPGGGQVPAPDPGKGRRGREQPGPQPAPDRVVHRQHLGEGEPDRGCGQPVDPAAGAGRLVARVGPGHPGRVGGRHLQGDLGPRVGRPDHQDAAVAQLGGAPVAGGVELEEGRVQVGGELGDSGVVVGPGGHDHVVGLEAAVPGADQEPFLLPGQPVHPDAAADRQLEAGRVGLQVVGHLVPGRVVPGVGREGHAGQPAVAARGVEAQRVPAPAPGVTDPPAGVQDHERPAPPGQVVAGGQPGLAAAHDHRLEPFRVPALPVHGRPPLRGRAEPRAGRAGRHRENPASSAPPAWVVLRGQGTRWCR